MQERHDKADHTLWVISKVYLTKPYSSWELQAAQWAAASKRPNFALPVFIEECEPPTLLAPFKRCELFGVSEDDARVRLTTYLTPAARPRAGARFSGRKQATAIVGGTIEDGLLSRRTRRNHEHTDRHPTPLSRP